MTRTRKMVAVGALAVVMVAGMLATGVVVRVASAQTATPGAQTSNLGEAFWQFLADRLGISLDQLTQAVKDAGKDTTAQGVTDGVFTQDQADSLNGRVDQWTPGQGGLPFGKGFGRGGHHGFGKLGGQASLDAVAQALGMTTAELTTELQAGKTLADLATENNVSEDTVKTAIVDAAKTQVDQAVTDGRLTQEQADLLKQQIDRYAASLDLSQPFFFGRHGFGHGRGFWGVPFGGPNPVPQTTPDDSGINL